MANYKNTKGFNIQYLDSDPPNPIEGQIWFNSTTQTFKGAEAGGVAAGTWASGGSLNTARSQPGGAGTQTAGLAFGGDSATGVTGVTEEYNGSTWTTLPATLNTARRSEGVGATSSAALFIAGRTATTDVANVESYNGTAWTEITDVNTARRNGSTAGIQTAALLFGGTSSPTALTELWNGTSWTEVNDLNTGRSQLGGLGNSTSALAIGGFIGPIRCSHRILGRTEEWTVPDIYIRTTS
jgi:hypothetical protein